jgi:hypothetical protein
VEITIMSAFANSSGLDIALTEFMQAHMIADQVVMTSSGAIWQAFLDANPGSAATKTSVTRSLRRLGYAIRHDRRGAFVVGVRIKSDVEQ